MDTQTQNMRTLLETLEQIDSIQESTPTFEMENTASMLRAFAKEILSNTDQDMAAAYMMRGADIIEELLAKTSQ